MISSVSTLRISQYDRDVLTKVYASLLAANNGSLILDPSTISGLSVFERRDRRIRHPSV